MKRNNAIALPFILVLVAMLHPGTGAMPRPQNATTPAVPIVRLDPRFNKLVPRDSVVEKIADGIEWAEGPVWNRAGGFLLFSDVPSNTIFKWKPGEGVSVFLKPSGYTGAVPFQGREPGSNGLTFDEEGRLVFCAHGDRRIARVEKDGSKTTLADKYLGKRLNSPNDLVFRSNGDLYFTDPPYGLPKTFDDPQKEVPFQGVYRLARDGKLTLLTKDLGAPNGIAFSPDERTLYVADSLSMKWWAFDLKDDDTIANGRVFFDGTELKKGRPGAPDGLKVDIHGNVFSAAPGGVAVIAPDGMLLGRFDFGVPTGNCAWGEDGSTFFVTSNHAVYRVRLTTKGTGF